MMTDAADGSVERALQLTGNTTFTVSLPKTWAIERGLEPGDTMYLYPYRDRVIAARDLLDPTDVSLSQSTAQLRQQALEVHREAIEAVCADDETLAKRVLDRVADVDRRVAFVTWGFYRGLEDVTEISRLDADRSSAFRSYQVARALEVLGNHAERIATLTLSESPSPGDDFAAELEAVATDARAALVFSLEGEPDQAVSARSTVFAGLETLERSLVAGEYPETETHLCGSILESIRRTVELSSEIPHDHTDD